MACNDCTKRMVKMIKEICILSKLNWKDAKNKDTCIANEAINPSYKHKYKCIKRLN